jgi:hypothetical protein
MPLTEDISSQALTLELSAKAVYQNKFMCQAGKRPEQSPPVMTGSGNQALSPTVISPSYHRLPFADCAIIA